MFEWIDCRYMAKEEFQKNNGTTAQNALMYIVKGNFTYSMAGQKDFVSSGDFVSFPAATYFERKIKEPIEFYHVIFENPEKKDLPVGKIEIKDRARLLSSLNYMCKLHQRPEENTELKNYFLNDIFVQLKVGKLIMSTENDDIVNRTTSFFEDNINKKISLEEAAEFAGVSVSGLIGHFNNTLGITPIKYLTVMRIKKSETLLCHTNSSISQIAEECGFDNAYYFSNTFKKHNAVSPSMYRKKYGV